MRVTIRPWRADEASTLQALADDPDVSRWMTASFSSPYTLADAERWLANVVKHDPPQLFAIEADGVVVGGGGVEPREGSHEGVAVVGYWLGKRYWGRGIATRALELLTERAFATGYRRAEANVFAPNKASARVLEKCGYTLEARLRASYVQRDGTPCDELIYGRLKTG